MYDNGIHWGKRPMDRAIDDDYRHALREAATVAVEWMMARRARDDAAYRDVVGDVDETERASVIALASVVAEEVILGGHNPYMVVEAPWHLRYARALVWDHAERIAYLASEFCAGRSPCAARMADIMTPTVGPFGDASPKDWLRLPA